MNYRSGGDRERDFQAKFRKNLPKGDRFTWHLPVSQVLRRIPLVEVLLESTPAAVRQAGVNFHAIGTVDAHVKNSS